MDYACSRFSNIRKVYAFWCVFRFATSFQNLFPKFSCFVHTNCFRLKGIRFKLSLWGGCSVFEFPLFRSMGSFNCFEKYIVWVLGLPLNLLVFEVGGSSVHNISPSHLYFYWNSCVNFLFARIGKQWNSPKEFSFGIFRTPSYCIIIAPSGPGGLLLRSTLILFSRGLSVFASVQLSAALLSATSVLSQQGQPNPPTSDVGPMVAW